MSLEAFKSTLEEVAEADLLVHVVDGSAQEPDVQIGAVREVLRELDETMIGLAPVKQRIRETAALLLVDQALPERVRTDIFLRSRGCRSMGRSISPSSADGAPRTKA